MCHEVEEDVKAASLWRRGKFVHSAVGPLPWLWPAKAALKSLRKRRLWKAASSLRSLVEGGWPTQFKLLCVGQAEHLRCACGKGAGTFRRKFGFCTLSDELRDAHCPTWLRRACEKEAWHPLFSRGVPVRPKPVQVPQEMVWFEAVVPESRCMASGGF